MATQVQYRYLEPRPRSHYRQLWVKGRHIRAEVLYRLTLGEEPRTPEEIAHDYALPVEVVQEAIDYAVHNRELLEAERVREAWRMKQLGLDGPPFIPPSDPTEA
jgi:uncharacterized protein (DUF433 family)